MRNQFFCGGSVPSPPASAPTLPWFHFSHQQLIDRARLYGTHFESCDLRLASSYGSQVEFVCNPKLLMLNSMCFFLSSSFLSHSHNLPDCD